MLVYIYRKEVLAKLIFSINTLKESDHLWQNPFCIFLVFSFHVLHFAFVSTNQDCPVVLHEITYLLHDAES